MYELNSFPYLGFSHDDEAKEDPALFDFLPEYNGTPTDDYEPNVIPTLSY